MSNPINPKEIIAVLPQTILARIVRCECGTVFYRIKRKKFCSERCCSRFYMRKYRSAKGRSS